ncbi:hypothetical protein [Pengzhenrongella phosphoraccumulans]|uniref:hypothetical protein n=1 Tax=Pengzhenrongella phosphoraccumulans TaxID=3114394 RepID=UPI00388FA3F2
MSVSFARACFVGADSTLSSPHEDPGEERQRSDEDPSCVVHPGVVGLKFREMRKVPDVVGSLDPEIDAGSRRDNPARRAPAD